MNNIDISSVKGASYAGQPEDFTMMYISKKVEHLLDNLHGHHGCLVFVEDTIVVPEELDRDNTIVKCPNPQFAYAQCATEFWKKQLASDKSRGYTLTDGGYYIGDNVKIGENPYIEPGVFIGHDVVIGDNAVILTGSVIKHAVIGDNFLCNEHAVIGNYSFTMADDENGNKFRIPALGRVVIGNWVEIGPFTDVAAGACGDTVLEDYVKIDALVHVGHEAHLHKNTEATAAAVIAGFVELEERSYLGVNSSLRNRIHLGENCVVGMGATVTKAVDANVTVAGNPAKPLIKSK